MHGETPPHLVIWPKISVEPLPTHYVRRGLGYRFVRDVLESTFGAAVLGHLHRRTATGRVRMPLADDLAGMESLFLGAHTASCDEIGVDPDPQVPVGGAARFASWVANISADSDLNADNRMMVPVFYDIQRNRVKVWAFIGWTSRPLFVSFATPPKVEVSGQGTVKQGWFSTRAEVYVSRLLNREEFRTHCDRYRTQKDILANLV